MIKYYLCLYFIKYLPKTYVDDRKITLAPVISTRIIQQEFLTILKLNNMIVGIEIILLGVTIFSNKMHIRYRNNKKKVNNVHLFC